MLQLLQMLSRSRVTFSLWLVDCYIMYTVRYSSGQERKDDLNRSRLPLFRQGGVTVGLMIRLRAERDQGGSIFIGRFVEAIREMLIRRDVVGIR